MSPPLIFNLLCALIIFVMAFAYTKDCDDCTEAGIMCRYAITDPGPACVNFRRRGFTEEEKMLAMQRMNEYRSKVALGKEKRGAPGPQPQAANMMELTWNDYLASTAQRYADQCTFAHSDEECRITDKYIFGENLGWSRNYWEGTYYLNHIDMWYEEVKHFPSNLTDYYDPSTVKEVIGHYAQLIYGKTYHVGCGKTRWGKEVIVVCHYGPSVPFKKPLYTRGPAASMCDNGINSSYEGLCASGPKIHLTYILLEFALFLCLIAVHDNY